MIYRGYQFKLYPTDEQTILFAQFAGVCRLVYNIALEQRRDHWRRFKAITLYSTIGDQIDQPEDIKNHALQRT